MIFHDALDIAEIVRQLLEEGWEIHPEDLAHIAPYPTEHIKRFGEYSTHELGIEPEAYDPKLDVDFTQLRDQEPAASGFGERDLLVGADGVGSAVRQVLTPRTNPRDTGVRFVIGRTPLTEQFAGLSRAYGGKIVGGGVSLLLGAMRFPIPPKEAAEKLAPEVTLPDIHDYVRWAMVLPPNGSLDTSTAQETALSRMKGWHPDLRALIEQADPDNSTLLPIGVVEPGERWAPGPVTLLGGAIHATPPTGGNGANTGLRDADLLGRCLIEAAEGRQDPLTAVDSYERQMFEYGGEAVRHSLAALPAFVPNLERPEPA
ncbi:Tn3 family transposase [Streptomyces sp. GS7]|nr:Tn3 family transposase [Streptomyces sp. GS7]